MGQTAQNIGIIGGGQLAWMMGPAAKKLGLRLIIQTPHPSDPAVAIADGLELGAVADATITAALAKQCNVISFENEFIDLPALQKLAQQGTGFYPQLRCLAPLLDKYDQRRYCQQLGLPSPRFTTLESEADLGQLDKRAASIGFPIALKTRRHGYDGQGTFILKSLEQVKTTWAQLTYQPVLLEAFVPFERELAVMVARSQDGKVAVYPVVESQQINQVCRRVIAPAAVGEAVVQQVNHIATQLVTKLDVVGIFGIELFLTADGQVLINEIAPRTHNSGHYTLDACFTSQFEQQLRAVSGLPLGSADMKCAQAVMINLLGFETATSDYQEHQNSLAALANAHLYWYGKQESRPGRKLGHITLTLDRIHSRDELNQLINQVESHWYPADNA
ncbi:5-(carboxyamino)imidazole ribonucleotide synthase [Leptothoe kymatousa]|uniref:N5-carboxyaminoimidazole ribonucleotide synthase n=1 Tax=Leptothoe kymatousa TAU-MAC 1615 TaxID=2364775 RepID=A0ABS5Y0X5_9CYAN|nr:5-(carboxyamino)imidazole ribonucleotide synthase [Leptothoe kymatousa]MBT9311477.1 5-(carboxyamino)imidazole ribonucleotide synthase [Leptothoe kymatousa TAU-MAC 1615]